jgi:hypothetical protein
MKGESISPWIKPAGPHLCVPRREPWNGIANAFSRKLELFQFRVGDALHLMIVTEKRFLARSSGHNRKSVTVHGDDSMASYVFIW